MAKKVKRRKRKRKTQIEIRQMTLEVLSEVWHLGEKSFTSSSLQFAYRTWNVDELLSLFYGDPQLCLAAEDQHSKKILGFALESY